MEHWRFTQMLSSCVVISLAFFINEVNSSRGLWRSLVSFSEDQPNPEELTDGRRVESAVGRIL